MIFNEDEELRKEILDGYLIYDGCFGFDANRYGFVLLENNEYKQRYRDPVPETKLLFVKMDEPIETRFYDVVSDDFGFSTMNACIEPERDYIAVDTGRLVFSWEHDSERKIDGTLPGLDKVCAVSNVVRVNKSLYVLGTKLRIYKRIGKTQWQNNLDTLPIPQYVIDDRYRSYSFNDMDGFSDNDMYAVGERGSAYHYDGKKWNQLYPPTNLSLETVTCAGDGQVYITDKNCSVWVGRNANWKMFVEQKKSLPFFDSAWFDGRMWFASDYGIWVLENDELVLAKNAKHKPIPEDVAILCGRIDISPDNQRMLVCGQLGAAVYDGERWEILFNCDPDTGTKMEDEDEE